jgi:uncharacterized protein
MPAAPRPVAHRLVLDTNVVVSALLWNGPPRRVMEQAFEPGTVELFSSAVLLDELAHTLAYPKFAARLARFETGVSALVERYTAWSPSSRPSAFPQWSWPMPMTTT